MADEKAHMLTALYRELGNPLELRKCDKKISSTHVAALGICVLTPLYMIQTMDNVDMKPIPVIGLIIALIGDLPYWVQMGLFV